MLNEIMDAVTRRLDEFFPNYTIYTDAVEQDLQEPCFFVGFLEPSEKPMIGGRYFRKTEVYIQFMPGTAGNLSRECNRVADILMDALEEIILQDGRKLCGTNRHCQTQDKILSFFSDYNQFLVKGKCDVEPMEDLRVKGEIL